MFLTRLIQYILGYIIITVDGGNPEKFLNLSARSGCVLWKMKRLGTAITACVPARSYKRLAAAAKKSGVVLTVEKHRGLPVHIHKHRKRWGFAVGIIAFGLIVWYLSGFVWRVEITGSKTVESREIYYQLADLGLKPGARSGKIDLKRLEQQMLIKMPQLSWMHINLDGGLAEVKVGERTGVPDIVPDNMPCNVKAAQTGQIISIQTYEGKAVLKKGDVVLKGGIIVSGVIEEPKTLVTRYVHASASVIARTRRELSVTVPLKKTLRVNTGKIKKIRTIHALTLDIPLYASTPHGSYSCGYTRSIYKSPMIIFGVKFPFSVDTVVFTEYKTENVTLTAAQAVAGAKTMLADKEKTEFSNAKIITKSYAQRPAKGAITLTGTYECEEDIAREQEIQLGQ